VDALALALVDQLMRVGHATSRDLRCSAPTLAARPGSLGSSEHVLDLLGAQDLLGPAGKVGGRRPIEALADLRGEGAELHAEQAPESLSNALVDQLLRGVASWGGG
jgi:hypothetical protein